MDKQFPTKIYTGYNYLSVLALELIPVSERASGVTCDFELNWVSIGSGNGFPC